MPRGMEQSRITGATVFDHMPAQERTTLVEAANTGDAVKLLRGKDVEKIAETLQGMGDQAAAKDILKKMKSSEIANVLSEPDMMELGANALNETSSRKVAQVLTELAENKPKQTANYLERMDPAARADVVKSMDKEVASRLMEGVRLEVRVEIADRLPPAKVAELLDGMRSAKNVAQTLLGMQENAKAFKKLDSGSKIEVILQVDRGEQRPEFVTNVLNKTRSRETAQVLTGVAQKKLEQGVDTLEDLNPKARAKAVKRMDDEVVSSLLDQTDARIGGEIADRLKPRKFVKSLRGMESSTKADEVIAHTNNEKAAAQLAEDLARGRTEAAARDAEATATARALETRFESAGVHAAADDANHLEPGRLAGALEKLERVKAIDVVQAMEDKNASEAVGEMKPIAVARLIREAGEEATVLLDKIPEKRMAPVLEELTTIDLELAERTFMTLNLDNRLKTMQAMNPEASAAIWKHMGAPETAEISRLLPYRTLDGMVQRMNPADVVSKMKQMDKKTANKLLVSLDNDPSKRSRQLKKGLGILATSTTVGLIDQIPIVGQHGGFAHIAENFKILTDSYLGAQTATLVIGNLGLRAASVVRIPKWVPREGGKILLNSPNTYQIANATGWASLGYLAQSIVMHFLH